MTTRTTIDAEEYAIRRRLPIRWPRRPVDVYVTRKTNFEAQLERCRRLLDSGEREVFVHGLGAAVTRALHLALRLRTTHAVELDVNTSTVPLVDDLMPETDDLPHDTRSRANSAVHIRLYRADAPKSAPPEVATGGTSSSQTEHFL